MKVKMSRRLYGNLKKVAKSERTTVDDVANFLLKESLKTVSDDEEPNYIG